MRPAKLVRRYTISLKPEDREAVQSCRPFPSPAADSADSSCAVSSATGAALLPAADSANLARAVAATSSATGAVKSSNARGYR